MIQLLSATGARPEAWDLCIKWMRRQTYSGPVRWVIVDDGEIAQTVPDIPRWDIEVIRPEPFWTLGQNTQARNMQAGLKRISDDAPLLIIEDDEHYAPGYLDQMARALESSDMAGQALCRKYNLHTRRAMEMSHPSQASLCATGLRGDATRGLRALCQAAPKLIDVQLWKLRRGVLFDGAYVTGMKRMPGRGGIDSGHRADFGNIHDKDGTLLSKWIGKDAEEYAPFMTHPRDTEIQAYVTAYKSPAYRMGGRRMEFTKGLLGTFSRGESLLDIGTGRGETLKIADTNGLIATGTEVVPYLLNERVLFAQAHAMPFEDCSFDHVTCLDVLEHLIEEDIKPALAEMLRVARKTCTVTVSELPSIYNGRDLHISRRPKAAWLALIQECWGATASQCGWAGKSPAYQVVK